MNSQIAIKSTCKDDNGINYIDSSCFIDKEKYENLKTINLKLDSTVTRIIIDLYETNDTEKMNYLSNLNPFNIIRIFTLLSKLYSTIGSRYLKVKLLEVFSKKINEKNWIKLLRKLDKKLSCEWYGLHGLVFNYFEREIVNNPEKLIEFKFIKETKKLNRDTESSLWKIIQSRINSLQKQ